MIDGWTIRVVRPTWVPETRWWYRHVLRRKMRYVEEVIFTGPAEGGHIEWNLNKPTNMNVLVRDPLSALGLHAYTPQYDTHPYEGCGCGS